MTISMSQATISSVPSNKVLAAAKVQTKEIYIITQEIREHIFDSDLTYEKIMSVRATNGTQEVYFTRENTRGFPLNVRIKENGSEVAFETIFSQVGSVYFDAFVIKTNTPLEFTNGIGKGIYCVPYVAQPSTPPPTIVLPDKVPTTTSLCDITNYINKTTESIKSCKSYIAYVINNKGGSATDTETLESLINKLKDINF